MNIKIIMILVFIISYIFTNAVQALQPDHTFNYQGQLIDNGVPANGSYDIIIDAYSLETGGLLLGSTSQHLGITVQNGLFNLTNVNVGNTPYDGEEVWLNIAVRPVGGVGFTNLSPRQLLQSVPYASKLANGFATQGQVYTFDNTFGWGPSDPVSNSPWVVSGPSISYSGEANIGAPLTAAPTNGLYVHANTYMGVRGSQASVDAKLDINSTASGVTADPLRVRKNGTIRFYVDSNGGTGIGSWATPPANGLQVAGDVQQPITSNGIMKYMVHVFCNLPTATIIKSYNGVNNGNITVTNSTNGCIINFPTDIDNRFFQASPTASTASAFGIRRAVQCSVSGGNNQLRCNLFRPDTGAVEVGSFMVLIY